MKKLILIFTFISLSASAQEVFQIDYQKGTTRHEAFQLIAKEGRKFQLKKTTTKMSKTSDLVFDAGNRLSELVTKLAFSEKTPAKCTEYITYSMNGQKGKVCQEERERTRDAIQLMHHLNSFF